MPCTTSESVDLIKFFITKSDKDYIIFPIENFSCYFEVTAKYRMKKSGSSPLSDLSKNDFEEALKKANISYKFKGLDITTDEELDGRKICGENRTYLLRKKEANQNRLASSKVFHEILFLFKS